MEELKPKSKMRAAVGVLNPVNHIRSAASAGLRPASEGWQLLTGMLGRLARHPAKPMPDAYDAAEHFRLKCARHGLDKQKLVVIELALLRTKRSVLFFLFVSLFLSLVTLINADRLYDVVVAGSMLSFTVFAAAKALQLSLQLRQVRDRSLWTWRQFLALYPARGDLAAFLLDPEL